MKIRQIRLSRMATFCYMAGDETTRTCALIDPAFDTKRILAEAREAGYETTHIINTHGHADHTAGNAAVKGATGADILIHEADARQLEKGLNRVFSRVLGGKGSPKPDVLLKDGEGYLLAVVPATHRIHLGRLHRVLDRWVGLATEDEVVGVFGDCEIGAVPPSGLLYDIDTLVDDALLEQPDVYFEAGDHERLIHMSRDDFGKLLGDATHGRFSVHA